MKSCASGKIGSSATDVLTSKGSHSGKYPFAEQIKARSAIRRSLDHLEAIDVPLGQTVGLFVCERPRHCILVAYQASGKLHQFWQPTCLSRC